MTSRALPLALLALAGCGGAASVELSPSSLQFGVRGQTAKVHASPFARNGKPVPEERCRWATSDAKVATVAGPANDVVVTAAGPGTARVTCAIGDVTAELSVLVRVVAKVEVLPAEIELQLRDDPSPSRLRISAVDDTGAPVVERPMLSRCAREEICRGDGRGQLWAVGPGDTTAWVEIEGARSADVKVHVVDVRSADAKPRAVKGNPMEKYEREYQRRLAEEKKAAEKAKATGK